MREIKLPSVLLSLCVICLTFSSSAQTAAKESPAHKVTKETKWNGFNQQHFTFDKRAAWVIIPKAPAKGNPWVWRARFPGFHNQIDHELVKKGFHIAYINTDGMLGSPAAVKQWNRYYTYVRKHYNLAKKPALYGVSRGGLFVYNWTANNPDKVACIYGDTPVCDFKSWPAGKGTGKGHKPTWTVLLKMYQFKNEAEALAYKHNPVDNLAPIAKAKIPLMHIVSETDTIVPPKENTYVIKKRYEKLGGTMHVISVTNGTAKSNGHHFPPQPKDIATAVNFIEKHAAEPLK